MDAIPPDSSREPSPQDSLDSERRIAELTGMTADSAHTYMDFVSGMRWLRRDRD